MKTSLSNHSNRTSLNCEQLESRTNPSNISVTFSSGNLLITGGVASHQYEVEQNSSGDVFVIGQNGTTVNGAASLDLGHVSLKNVTINDGSGGDYITVVGVRISNALNISTGSGNDYVDLNNVVATNIAVHESNGNNVLVTTNVVAIDTAVLDAGTQSGFSVWYDNSVIAGSLSDHGWSEVFG